MASALSFLLEQPNCTALVLSALKTGEIDPSLALSDTPHLLARAVSKMVGYQLERDLQVELVQHLINLKFNPWLPDEEGRDAFDHALALGNPNLISLLAQLDDAPGGLPYRLNPRDQSSPFFGADTQTTRVLLDLGIDPHAVSSNGDTPLHGTRRPELAQLLLEAGVSPYQQNNNGVDAISVWDASNLPMDAKRELSKMVDRLSPRSPNELVKTFGKQMLDVGASLTKERLARAKMDPQTAQHLGFSLPELLIAHIFDQGMENKGRHSDVVEQRKLRRLVLSALKLHTKDPSQTTQRLQGLVRAFYVISNAMSDTPKEAIFGQPVLPDPDPIDLTPWSVDSLHTANGMLGSIQAIEDLRGAGLIANPSWVYGWLVNAYRSSKMARKEWLTPSDDGTPLFFKVNYLATRGLWDDTWKEKHSLVQSSAMRLEHSTPEFFYPYAATVPHGIAVLLCLNRGGNKEGVAALMETLDQYGDDGTLSLEDPALCWGLARWKASTNDSLDMSLIQKIELLAQHNDLRAATPSVSRAGIRRI